MNRANFTIAVGILVTALVSISLAKGQDAKKRLNDVLKTLEDHQGKDRRDRVAWVDKCLKDFDAIKVGMTRKDLEKRFQMDGGVQGVSLGRFTHPECPYFKIDVRFAFKRNPQDQGRAIFSPDDRATKVSKPYIETPYID